MARGGDDGGGDWSLCEMDETGTLIAGTGDPAEKERCDEIIIQGCGKEQAAYAKRSGFSSELHRA